MSDDRIEGARWVLDLYKYRGIGHESIRRLVSLGVASWQDCLSLTESDLKGIGMRYRGRRNLIEIARERTKQDD